MMRSIVIGVGSLLVVALAVWSDHEWRRREQLRREAQIEQSDDPALAAEVRAAIIARRSPRPQTENTLPTAP